MPAPTAAEIIAKLDLKPHPEGGHYRETFRDTHLVDGRAASTAIMPRTLSKPTIVRRFLANT